jgi:hypothetical protein
MNYIPASNLFCIFEKKYFNREIFRDQQIIVFYDK